MRIAPSALAATFATIVLALTRAAAAEPPLVIEAHVGERAADVETILAPVHAAFAKRGFRVGDKLVAEIERTVSGGSGQLSATQAVEAKRALDRGWDHFTSGEYDRAVSTTQKALALYASAPAQMAKEPPLRDLQWKAFLIVARSYEVLGKGEEAFATMSEAIRTFPDRHVSAAEFDPRVNALYRRVKEELNKQGTGSLEVRVDDTSAVIFLNSRFVGSGSVKVDLLYPGEYQVYIARGTQPGRVHRARVNPGEAATLSLSWHLDGLLRTRSGYVGLEFPAGTSTEQELAAATRLGRELGAQTVIVLSVRAIDRRRSIVGYTVRTDSQTRVFAATQIEPVEPPIATLDNLAALLAGDKRVDTTGLVTREPTAARVVAASGTERWYHDTFGWGLTGGGVIVAAAGTGLLWSASDLNDRANHEGGQGDRQDLRDRSRTRLLLGSAVTAVGIGVLATGVVRLISAGPSSQGESSAAQARTHLVIGLRSITLVGSF